MARSEVAWPSRKTGISNKTASGSPHHLAATRDDEKKNASWRKAVGKLYFSSQKSVFTWPHPKVHQAASPGTRPYLN
ncbi:MAG: hypothetical protein K2Q34_04595 [Alphaproteobacteria bacterium]|nr:hypothetical protein [Alphaproteobacteria bacterium]